MTRAISISRARMYDVIVAPVITEKSTRLGELSQVVFKVRPEATKLEIAAAVRGLFGVEVRSVNTMVTKGKVKRFRGSTGKRSDVKKAIVTLAEGQSIDVTTGV